MKQPDKRRLPMPRTPVLDWSSFSKREPPSQVKSIGDISHAVFTTSGRAAIYQALLQLRLEPGSLVLAPSYHCPTMIAPVILAGLKIGYFGIRADGLPNLHTVDVLTASRAKAIIVPHYFGLPRSLLEVRQWCDQHRIALIEDCAHCYFGNAGERPVGTWGDFATASLSKFFPVPEGGVLVSAENTVKAPSLSQPSFKAQLKGYVDVLELATRHGRFRGINRALSGFFRLKNSFARGRANHSDTNAPAVDDDMMPSCDMGRIVQAPLSIALSLESTLPRGRIIARRRQNFALYARHFAPVREMKEIFPWTDESAVPYVFPLWVEEADRIYQELRSQGLPVFRWDRIWPGTPQMTDDLGPSWSHHVLQFLCHQDLSEADITATAVATLTLLANPQVPVAAIAQ